MKRYIFIDDFYDIAYNFKPYNPRKGESFIEREDDGWFKFNRTGEHWAIAPRLIDELVVKGVLKQAT
jgi:hypothetical protein